MHTRRYLLAGAATVLVAALTSSAAAANPRLSSDAACNALGRATLAHASMMVNEQLGNTGPSADVWRWKHRDGYAYSADRRGRRSVRCIVSHLAVTLDGSGLVVVEYAGVVRGTSRTPRVSASTRFGSAGAFQHQTVPSAPA
jgi:hypothetical protein